MTKGEKPYDGYIRVSRIAGRAGDTFIAADVQRQEIEASAKAYGLTIGEYFEELDVSGGGLDRPQLNEAMERIRYGVSGGIIVARLDRLSRAGVGDALKLVEEIHGHGAKIAALDLGVDPTTPAGELMMTLMLALGRMERRRIGDNWRVAQTEAIKRGVYIASKAPTGYKHRDDKRLVPNRDADQIRDVFRMRAAGASWRECCDFLNEHGVVGPWGEGNWQADAVAGIIKNRAYLGESRFGDELVNKTAHAALIDPATWLAAQTAPKNSVPRSGEGLLLSGFIRCAGCRYLMKPGHINHRGKRVVRYHCGRQYAVGKCNRPASALGHVIEPYVIEQFTAMIGDAQVTSERDNEEADRLIAELAIKQGELEQYRDDDRVINTIGMDSFVEGLQKRQTWITEVEDRLGEIKRTQTGLGQVDLLEVFENGSLTDRRELLHSVIGSVFVRNLGKRAPIATRAAVLRHFEMPDDLPRRGRRVPIKSLDWPTE